MNKEMEVLKNWDRKSALLIRIDYGYEIPISRGEIFDGSKTSLRKLCQFLENGEPATILNSHYLLSFRRKDNLLDELLKSASCSGSILETRFPKYFKIFVKTFEKNSLSYFSLEVESNGEFPPFYLQFQRNESLLLHNLQFEWESGLLTSRGKSVLIEIAEILSQNDSKVNLTEIASSLGISLGATLSYLKWMEEASLIRRENKLYSLRHKGLNLLFKRGYTGKIREKVKFSMEID